MEHQPGLDSDCCFTYFHNICFHVLSCSLLEKRKTLFVVFNLAFTSDEVAWLAAFSFAELVC
jgi:hypothetical protein